MNKNVSSSVFSLSRASVAFHTPSGPQLVLDDIDLDIRPGEWVALVGRNGSGKSTLAKVLAGLLPLSRGTLSIRRGVRPRLVFQQPEAQIVGETVFEDIAFGLENNAVAPAEMIPQANAALKAAGLNIALDRPARELSGGQKQLLAVAGCMALNAEVLIFDETASMLDPMGRRRLLGTVGELHRRGSTIIWVTQMLEETASADRVVALDGKKVVYDGDVRGFYYGAEAPCERIGFAPPYAVQVARRLLREGQQLPLLPLNPEQLAQAVTTICRS